MKNRPTILGVDDEKQILKALRRSLNDEDYNLITCESAQKAMEVINDQAVDLVITDLRMPETDGLEFLMWVKKNYPSIIRFVMTGCNDIRYVMDAVNKGEIYKFILKPWSNENLIIDIRQALDHAMRLRKNKELQELTRKQNKELKEFNENLERLVRERTCELREKTAYLENLFETANELICTVNSEGIVTFVNGQIEKFGFKRNELLDKPFTYLIKYKKDRDLFEKKFNIRERSTFELKLKNKKNGYEIITLSASPIKNDRKVTGALLIGLIVTDKKILEKQLIQSEMLALAGEMTVEIAHELNNYLSVAMGNVDLLIEKPEIHDANKKTERIKKVRRYLRRMEKFTKGLLGMSLTEKNEVSADINNLILETIDFLKPQNKYNDVEFINELSDDLRQVTIDRDKIQQVLINLYDNAAHIMRKGTITTITLSDKGHAVIRIADTGPGIPKNKLKKIFQAGYTTREKGRGIGLSICRRIIQNHEGSIDVESTVNKGTTFIIKLPYEKK